MTTLFFPSDTPFLIAFLIRFFFVFGLLCFAVGIGLILSDARLQTFFAVMNRWVSLRRSTRWLAVPHAIEPFVARHRRLLGGAIALLAIHFTSVLAGIDTARIGTLLSTETAPALLTWIVEGLRLSLMAGGALAVAVGAMLLFFPEALRAVEARANHWYSLRNLSRKGDAMHLTLDTLTASHPRAVGWVIAPAALIVVVNFGFRLFGSA